DNPSCRNQPALTVDEGCGKGLDAWIAKLSKSASASAAAPAQKKPGATPLRASKGKHLITVAQLPRDCRTVLQAPSMAAAR
ncbi:MAG: penicillin-insensitive murein endopeptidase, partial [Rhodomicrobium sp.]